MKILLAGGTGLVGAAFLDGAIARGWEVSAIGRRATGIATRDIISDFVEIPKLPEVDVTVSALGTTIAAAGSRRAFRAVDYDAVVNLATAASATRPTRFILVSAVGANPRAAAFYSRVKGEVERDLAQLPLQRLDILQPGLLLGERTERRPVESMLQAIAPAAAQVLRGPLSKYAGISADTVAKAMLALVRETEGGVFRYENRALEELAQQV
ncbi:MAG: oxidoreductase [Congregibacter sp.]